MKQRAKAEGIPIPTIYEDNTRQDKLLSNFLHTTHARQHCISKGHSIYPAFQKQLPTSTYKKIGAELLLETSSFFPLTTSTHKYWSLPLQTIWYILLLPILSSVRNIFLLPISLPPALHNPCHGRSMYPLVFALLPGKDETIYTCLFSHVRFSAQQHQLQLHPDTLYTIYETATKKVACTVFPRITIKGCFFHFTKLFWRKTQKCGLQTYYKENNDISQLVRRAQFYQLFCSTWNHYQTGGPHTTNHLEGWHNKIKKKVHRTHPDIYGIIELLQMQAVTEYTIIQ